MTTVLVDTYKAVSTLRENGFSKEQAEGVVKVMEQIDLSSLATKEDLLKLEAKIESVKTDLIKWLVPILLGQIAVFFALVKFL